MTHFYWLVLSVWAVDFVALVSPGPNFLMVTQTAMRRSRHYALMVALGIASGSAVWGTAVAVGLSAMFGVVPWLHTALKIGGAAYLMYLGTRLWRNDQVQHEVDLSPERSLLGAYSRGLLTNILNPKSAAYYGSVFALFFPPGTPAWVLAASIALISLTSVLWHTVVAVLFSTDRVRRAYGGLRGVINRVAGVVMTGFGVRLLLARD